MRDGVAAIRTYTIENECLDSGARLEALCAIARTY